MLEMKLASTLHLNTHTPELIAYGLMQRLAHCRSGCDRFLIMWCLLNVFAISMCMMPSEANLQLSSTI